MRNHWMLQMGAKQIASEIEAKYVRKNFFDNAWAISTLIAQHRRFSKKLRFVINVDDAESITSVIAEIDD